MKIASALIVSLAAGSIVSAQTPDIARVGGYGKINWIRIGHRVYRPSHPTPQRVPAVVYDNWPAAGGFPFYFQGGNRVLDKMSLTPGPAAGGPVALTSLDTFGVAAPQGDPGGSFDSTFKFYNTIDEAATTGQPVNTAQLGQTITINATVGPNPFTQGAVVWLFAPIDITAAGITIPDDDFGVSQEVFIPTTTTLSTTYLPNFNGQPFPPAVGNSADWFYWDANADGVFTADPDEQFQFNTTTNPFFSNLLLKLTGEPGGGPTPCYADCDGVGGLTANDFVCFVSAYTNGESYADCDAVGGLTANDFVCFLTAYTNGCS